MLANVAFDIPQSKPFTYLVPDELHEAVAPGVRVLAPIGPRLLTGYIIDFPPQAPQAFELRAIHDVLDPQPLLSDAMLRLAFWIADYYLCGIGEVLRAILPSGISLESKRIIRLAIDADMLGLPTKPQNVAQQILAILQQQGKISISALKKRVGKTPIEHSLRKLEARGLVRIEGELQGRSHAAKIENFVRLAMPAASAKAAISSRASRQIAIIDSLIRAGGSKRQLDLLRETKASSDALRRLQRAGFIETFERRVERDYYGDLQVPPAPRLVLNDEQQQAVDAICAASDTGEPATFLIHGVTGSGKTQVYIEAIRHVLALERDAIVLVPEISLTPQTVRRFRSEFQDQVAVLHSRMSAGERYDAWCKIREGRARVVAGPRSAIFAPVQRLGLVVVDEEHEGSYKQTENPPRYHARDIATVRGSFENAVVVLGSATPSMESYANARRGKYRLIEMQKRIDDIPLPQVIVQNLATERRSNQPKDSEAILSRLLLTKINEKLERQEQVILLQNRRGFSSAVICRDCGHVEMCANCNISMSYHLHGLQMRCHYCDTRKTAPEGCPKCGSAEIKYRGVGTQKVESHLKQALPLARIARMDLDTTRGRKAHDRILDAFAAQKYDILLGTQMIAKGLDFPRVTLVGVISADTGLFLPDFRAAERTFQLLTQVAGRAGRKSAQGDVIIQTYSPEHYCIQFARNHDFKGFYFQEAHDRRMLRYPPYGRLALLQFRHTDEQQASRAAASLATFLQQPQAPYEILGPAPAPLSKLQQYYRFQVIVRSDRTVDATGAQTRDAIAAALDRYREQPGFTQVKLAVDIDPVVIL